MKRIDHFLTEAMKAGITFEIPEPGKLIIEGPDEAFDRFLPEIKSRKPEILSFLAPDPADGILDALAEYDMLIDQLCGLRGDSQEHRNKLLAARRSMAPADLHDDLEKFRQIVDHEKTRRHAA